MALPAHLARYSSLIDFLVEQLVADARAGADVHHEAELRALKRGAGADSAPGPQAAVKPGT
jgi:hypothetical protein